MFKITLSPIAANSNTAISATGDTLTVDGVAVDFSVIPSGGCAEGDYPIIGTVKNVGGDYHLTIAYKYDTETAELNQSTDINDYIVDLVSGDIVSPIVQKEVA